MILKCVSCLVLRHFGSHEPSAKSLSVTALNSTHILSENVIFLFSYFFFLQVLKSCTKKKNHWYQNVLVLSPKNVSFACLQNMTLAFRLRVAVIYASDLIPES